MNTRRVLSLTAMMLLVFQTGPFAQPCDYYPVPSLELDYVTLYSPLGVPIRSSGDIVYWFDSNGHLDALSLEDPTNFQPTFYDPPIFINPGPTGLLKIGADRLYAYHRDGGTGDRLVTVIDISNPVLPTVTATVPAFEPAVAYLGSSGAYAYFLDEYGIYVNILTYDLTDPDNPQFASSTPVPTVPEYIDVEDAFMDGEYILLSGDQNLWVFDTIDPVAPALAKKYRYYELLDGVDWRPLMAREGRFYVRAWVHFEGWTSILNIENPVDTVFEDPLLGRYWNIFPYAVAGDYLYGYRFETDPTLKYWLGLHYSDAGEIQEFYINDRLGFFTLTDAACVYTMAGDNHVYAFPRQCDPAAIVGNSVSFAREPAPGGKEIWTFTWVTDKWTDPKLDKVVIRDTPKNSPLCQIGTIVLSGNGTVESLPQGGYQHTVTYRWQECTAGCKYQYDISSRRTGIVAASNGHRFTVPYCFGPLPVSDATIPDTDRTRLIASPNPFNPSTLIEFFVPQSEDHVRLTIYDVAGRRVRSLFDGPTGSGWRQVEWDGSDSSGSPSTSGIYFVVLEQSETFLVQKLVLIK